MKKYILTAFLILCLVGYVSAGMIIQKFSSAGGGPDVYYYGSGNSSGDYTTGSTAISEPQAAGDDITITSGGTITQVGVRINTSSDFECRIYQSDGTLRGCYQATATADSWSNASVSPGLSVNDSDSIYVMLTIDGGGSVYYNAVFGGRFNSNLFSYGDSCSGDLTSEGSATFAVRVYVD